MEWLMTGRKILLMDKVGILTSAAKFDVACTSSVVERKGAGNSMGNCIKEGICHSFSSDGRGISLMKKLFPAFYLAYEEKRNHSDTMISLTDE